MKDNPNVADNLEITELYDNFKSLYSKNAVDENTFFDVNITDDHLDKEINMSEIKQQYFHKITIKGAAKIR